MQHQPPQILELIERFRSHTGLTLSRTDAEIGITFQVTIPHEQLAHAVCSALTFAASSGLPACEVAERIQQYGGNGFNYSIRSWAVQIGYNTLTALLEQPKALKQFRQELGPLVKTIQDLSYRLLDVASDVQNCQRMVTEQLQELRAAA